MVVSSELKFQNLQSALDEQSRKINAGKQEGTANRHALTARTKEFRKLDDSGKLAELRTLLKSYQSEIDSLTERCKYAESCFMNAYKSLAPMPNPYALVLSQERELQKLREQSEQRPDTGADMAKQLERQIKYNAQLEKKLRDASNSDPNSTPDVEVNAKFDAKIDALDLELSETRSQLAQSQTKARDWEAYAHRQQTELNDAHAKLAAQQDYADIKLENKELRTELVGAEQEETGSDSSAAEIALRKRVIALEQRALNAETEAQTLKAHIKDQSELVHKLEDDLSQVNISDSLTTVSGWTAFTRGTSLSRQPDLSQPAAKPPQGSPVPILTEQRDRYRQRAQELQEKCHQSESELEGKRKELETARREIYTLYDRMRYLQQAAGPNSAGSTSLYTPNPQFLLKELDLERRTAGLTKPEAVLLQLHARGVVDPTFRRLTALYFAAVHLALVASLLH